MVEGFGPAKELFFFFFNDTATTEIYTLSLHDALPIYLTGIVRALFSSLLDFHKSAENGLTSGFESGSQRLQQFIITTWPHKIYNNHEDIG